MMQKPFIAGFAGPCLAGKSTTIRRLKNQFEKKGWSVLCIPEYVEYVGKGPNRWPSLFPRNEMIARQGAEFFVELEKRRRQEIEHWVTNHNSNSTSIILVDRLLVFCLAVKRKVNDLIGYETLLNAVKAGRMIVPDVTFFLRLSISKEEYKRRLKSRTLSQNEDILYGLRDDYELFFRHFTKEIINVNPMFSESSRVDEIFHTLCYILRERWPK